MPDEGVDVAKGERAVPVEAAGAGATRINAGSVSEGGSHQGDLALELQRTRDERDALRRACEDRAPVPLESDRLTDEFIDMVGHDLKGPLTSITTYTQFLARLVAVPSPDLKQVGDGLAVIHAQATSMAQLLDEVLDASRIRAGVFELHMESCDLGACLDTVLLRLQPEDRDRVDVVLAEAPLVGEWARPQLEQVLTNVIGNALKYSPACERVSVTVRRSLGTIDVSVSDRGIGIPVAERTRIFERFYRTPEAHATGLVGSGLGLYISRGIIAAHGGRLWAESPGDGRGTTIRLTLPIAGTTGGGNSPDAPADRSTREP